MRLRMRREFCPDACAASLRLERVANPNGHFCGSGERKNVRVQDFRSARGERVGVVVAEIVEELRLRVFVGIRGVDAVDVGPDDEFVGIDDVRDDCA